MLGDGTVSEATDKPLPHVAGPPPLPPSALPTSFSCFLFLQPPRCRGLAYLDAQEARRLVFLLNDSDPTRGLEGAAPYTAEMVSKPTQHEERSATSFLPMRDPH
jgi:hypothetical protein